jgi:tetratricopeptide (TPR) repeat protein
VSLPLRAAAEDRTQTYDQSIQDAIREFDAGNYQEARALFERAHAERPSARTSRALGFCSFELHQYVQALRELEEALRDHRHALTEPQRAEANATLAKARSFIGLVTLVTEPAQAEVLIDGRAADERLLRLDPGEHVIVASAPGFRARELTVTVMSGSEQTLQLPLVPLELAPARAASTSDMTRLDPPPSAAPVTERWWFWTAIGAVAAGAAVATAVALGHQESKVDGGSSGVVLESLRRGARP